ncbi:MAG: type IV secretory system conjugative DNA transfer family protein [Pseudomonadota bacterium]
MNISAMVLEPSRATLSGLWEFAVQEEDEFWSAIFEASQHPKLPRALRMKAKNFYEEYVNILGTVELDNGLLQATEIQNKSGKMQEYSGHVRSHVRDTLRIYEPGSVFDDITSETNFDVAGLLRQPGSLFLVLTEEFMTVGESWAALMFSSLMKELALIDGHVKCTWMMDEITTLPPIPNYLTNMLRLRSKGHQFVSIAHSRSALDRVYGEKDRKGIEDAAAVTIFWDQGGDVKLCEEVSRLAGEMNVPMMVPSVNNSVDSDGASFGLQIQKTPLATPGQVAGVSNGSQVVLTRSYPRVGTMSRVHYDSIAAYKAVIRPPIEMLG